MQGYVLVFRPSTGNGMIESEHGETFRFTAPIGDTPLHAGDRVSFEAAAHPTGSPRMANAVSMLSAWADRLPPAERTSLAAMCDDLQIQTAG